MLIKPGLDRIAKCAVWVTIGVEVPTHGSVVQRDHTVSAVPSFHREASLWIAEAAKERLRHRVLAPRDLIRHVDSMRHPHPTLGTAARSTRPEVATPSVIKGRTETLHPDHGRVDYSQ
jgi:hypothetical protein